MVVFETLALLFLLPAVVVLLYYLALAGVALLAPSGRGMVPGRGQTSFAILIPAHNEETQIALALQSCFQLDYPREKHRVFVIADNCTDGTAAVARSQGAACLIRQDDKLAGKGHALAWALEHILPLKPDAVVVVDADCRLEPHALRTFDRYLTAGSAVLQAAYTSANPDESIVSYVSTVASRIENDLFYAPKSRLGLAVMLRGTGMVFRRQVLERCPWQAGSLVEDTEYTLRLHRAGIQVTFVPETCLQTVFPAQQQQLGIQRRRWIGGNARFALGQVVPLLVQGLTRCRPLLLDLAWTMLVCIRSLVMVQLALTVLLACLAAWQVPGPRAQGLLWTSLVVTGLYALYFALGVIQVGLDGRRLRLLLGAPLTVLRLMLVASLSIWPERQRSWGRTPR